MLATIRSLWIWTASTFLILVWVPWLGLIWLLDRNPAKLRTAIMFRRLGRALAKVNPWRVHIRGTENLEPGKRYVVVSNHQSLADIPLIAHLDLDAKWLAKAELFRIPLVGWMMRMAGDVPVDRADRRKAAQALLRCARILRDQCSVMFFPEGTRSPDGSLQPFNDGPFQLALREQAPVLPLVVEGSGAALPRGTWMFGGMQDIYLRVLPAITVNGFDPKQPAVLREQVRAAIQAELDALRSSAG